MKNLAFIPLLIIVGLIGITPVFSAIGVGVGTGQIAIDETLRPGVTYNLPEVLVYNTGDVASEYAMSIEYSDREDKLKPDKDWFTFEPQVFSLEPGDSKSVQVKMTLPITDVSPGDYFAFITAQPVVEVEEGVTSVGVAAGTKLYFTIEAANVLQAIYFKTASLFLSYHPWSTIALSLVVIAVLVRILKKKFRFQIVAKKETTEEN